MPARVVQEAKRAFVSVLLYLCQQFPQLYLISLLLCEKIEKPAQIIRKPPERVACCTSSGVTITLS